jgi:hypothetical protein
VDDIPLNPVDLFQRLRIAHREHEDGNQERIKEHEQEQKTLPAVEAQLFAKVGKPPLELEDQGPKHRSQDPLLARISCGESSTAAEYCSVTCLSEDRQFVPVGRTIARL